VKRDFGPRRPVIGRAIHGRASHVVPVHAVHRSGAHPHQEAVVGDLRLLHFLELNPSGGPYLSRTIAFIVVARSLAGATIYPLSFVQCKLTV
jgi:hypothetical protein